MTIGLSATQIRKLAKRAYSDKQIERESTGEIYWSGDKWWTNGQIVFFEPMPDNVEPSRVTSTRIVEQAKHLARMIADCNREVYPVEVRSHLGKRVLSFENGCGDCVIVNARYAASVLATKRVGRKRDPGVQWYTNGKEGQTLLAVNGRKVGLICGIVNIKVEPEWNFRYTGELPKGG